MYASASYTMHRFVMGMHRFVMGMHRFVMGMHRFVMGMHRFVMGMHRFVMGMHRFVMGMHRFVMGMHRFVMGMHRFVMGMHRREGYHIRGNTRRNKLTLLLLQANRYMQKYGMSSGHSSLRDRKVTSNQLRAFARTRSQNVKW